MACVDSDRNGDYQQIAEDLEVWHETRHSDFYSGFSYVNSSKDRDANMAYDAILFVVSHRRIMGYKTRKR
jgi:hypothetical protein